MIELPHRADYKKNAGEKWDSCCMCGSLLKEALVYYEDAYIEPTDGETITGATSGDNGSLVGHTETSAANVVYGVYDYGSGVRYGGEVSAGVMNMGSLSSYNESALSFLQDGERINGSVSGTPFATVKSEGSVAISGRLIPVSEIVEYEGKKYCVPHFKMKFNRQFQDDVMRVPEDWECL